MLDLGLFEQAVELLEQEIKEHPKNAKAHFVLANAHVGQLFQSKPERDYEWKRETAEKAFEAYQTSLKLKPDYAMAHYNLAAFLDLDLYES